MTRPRRFADVVWRCVLYGTPCYAAVGLAMILAGMFYFSFPGLVGLVLSPAVALAHGVALAWVTLARFHPPPEDEWRYRDAIHWVSPAVYALAGVACCAPAGMALLSLVPGLVVGDAVARRYLRLVRENGCAAR